MADPATGVIGQVFDTIRSVTGAGALTMGFSHYDLHAFSVTHHAFIGRTISQLAAEFPDTPFLRVVRDGKVMRPGDDPAIQQDDIVTLRADVHDLILKDGELIGLESDEPLARQEPLEVADVHVGAQAQAAKSLAELDQVKAGGVAVQALFRIGNELPLGPKSNVRFNDVLRLTGPDAALHAAAKKLGGHVILPTMKSEVLYLALAMLTGYLVGIVTVTVSGIPFALGTSAGVIMAGICVSYWRSRNPGFGGPVHEGARSFLQDFGLNAFVAAVRFDHGHGGYGTGFGRHLPERRSRWTPRHGIAPHNWSPWKRHRLLTPSQRAMRCRSRESTFTPAVAVPEATPISPCCRAASRRATRAARVEAATGLVSSPPGGKPL